MSLNLGDNSVSLESLSCPQKMLYILIVQLACLDHCFGFIIQKSGGFLRLIAIQFKGSRSSQLQHLSFRSTSTLCIHEGVSWKYV